MESVELRFAPRPSTDALLSSKKTSLCALAARRRAVCRNRSAPQAPARLREGTRDRFPSLVNPETCLRRKKIFVKTLYTFQRKNSRTIS